MSRRVHSKNNMLGLAVLNDGEVVDKKRKEREVTCLAFSKALERSLCPKSTSLNIFGH